MDIHNYKRQYERQVELLKEDKKILQVNKEISLKFRDYLLSEGIGVAKIGRYLLDIRKYAKMLKKPFDEADKDDLRRVVGEIEQSELAPESKKCFKIMLRKLYRFIRGIDEKGIYPDEVKWISIRLPKNHKKLPEELLTEEEIKSIIRNCKTLRDKALVSTLSESGCRISEIGNMKLKNVSFEKYGARITVNGKTGMRKILVINSSPYLQQWINEHPKNDEQDTPLWYNPQGEFLTYAAIMKIIRNASKRAGIKKRVYAHLFRHSRATQVASQMSEASMKQYFGWGQDSKMCGIYIHMSGEVMDKAILKMNGIEVKEEKKEKKLKEKICLRCKTKNGVTNRCCYHCGMILDEDFAQEKVKEDLDRQKADKLMNNLMQDPEVLELIKKKLNG
jgi:integrase/recombinase XerD